MRICTGVYIVGGWVKQSSLEKKLRPAAKLEKIRIKNINICQIQ